MQAEPYFKERQRSPFWLLLPVYLIDALLAYGCVVQLGFGKPFGTKPTTNSVMILIACLVFLLSYVLSSIALDTEISADGISVRFTPFIWRWKRYSWDKVSAAYVAEYSPMRDFGGWGIKWGGGGTAYSISGNFGIQLVFRDGKRLLIGTARAAEAEAALERVGRLKK
jgi:hypothetical protein